MQNLYQKYKQTGLEEAETNNLLQIRKLLQLKTLVTTLLDDSRYFSEITLDDGPQKLAYLLVQSGIFPMILTYVI